MGATAYETAQTVINVMHPTFRQSFVERQASDMGVDANTVVGLKAVLDRVMSDEYEFAHQVRDFIEQN